MSLIDSGQHAFIEVSREINLMVRNDRQRVERQQTLQRNRLVDMLIGPDGLGGMLDELAALLHTWVVCLDERAEPLGAPARLPAARSAMLQIRGAAVELLDRGVIGGLPVTVEGETGRVESFGSTRSLAGVMAHGPTRLPHDEERSLMGWAMALLRVWLLGQTEARALRDDLRRAAFRLLLAGSQDAAHDTIGPLGRLPEEPVAVFAAASETLSSSEVTARLERRLGKDCFICTEDGHVAGITPAGSLEGDPDESIRVDSSLAVTYDSIGEGYAQARQALRAAQTRRMPMVSYLPETAPSMLAAMLATPGMSELGARVLQPLTAYDKEHGSQLEATLQVWLSSSGRWEEAATALGVHRHTLRSRIDRCGRVLGKDLGDADVRSDLWLALEAAGSRGGAR